MTARVLIDGHMLGSGETGNETYLRGLLSGLTELGLRELVAVSGPDVDVGGTTASSSPAAPTSRA